MSARITPGSLRQLGIPAFAMSRVAGKVTGTTPPAIFTTLGRAKGLYWGWLHFAARLMPFGSLPRRESELVILRVAHRRGSAYEWAHHVRLGERVGVTEQDLVALQDDTSDHWSAREATLLASADALLTGRDLDDSQWERLSSTLTERECVEFLLLVGHYDMLATTLHTLRVSPDAPASVHGAGQAETDAQAIRAFRG
ncbi:carboxymuconolactone decarboxylase family protein [Yimella sp. cx-573]|nr:carboxymuconolactone decarboxylase family protein [Yimella sp. cx-573]